MSSERSRPVLVTGAADFIGAAPCQRLLESGDQVIGIYNLNSYYDPDLKLAWGCPSSVRTPIATASATGCKCWYCCGPWRSTCCAATVSAQSALV